MTVQAAQLSFTDRKGYYGLTVMPSYEEMLRSLKNEVRIPQPDRSAKWYATGIYRAFLLEQAKRYNDAQRKDLEYDATGAHLPAAAERGAGESMAGTDDTWNRQEQFNSNLNAEEARKIAEDALASEQKAQANQMRRQQLSAYGPTQGHWTVTRTWSIGASLTRHPCPSLPRLRGGGKRLPTSGLAWDSPCPRSSRPSSN